MRYKLTSFIILIALGLSLAVSTNQQLRPFPAYLGDVYHHQIKKPQILDRHRHALTITYQNHWNIHDHLALHEIPLRLQQFFIQAEDQRFYQHNGIDSRARLHAIWQNIRAGRVVRGASTISEQVVRLLHPRRRSFWSRWLESWEVLRLEKQFSKVDILEFYLNQVPYARLQRGVVQAARYYFDRDLNTLNQQEMLALAVLVRSPSRLDLQRGQTKIQAPMRRLADRLLTQKLMSAKEYHVLWQQPLQLSSPQLPVQASHFVQHLLQKKSPRQTRARIHTTLDSVIQQQVQAMLDKRLQDLASAQVQNGAVLVVDNQRAEILAWVNGNDFFSEQAGSQIDAVLSPRQPGSSLKPFIYALALEKGWTAATLIHDAPLTEAIGTGLHSYRNYSEQYYGWLRLRDALGNSLNTPAVRTAQFVGIDHFLDRLKKLGMFSLTDDVLFYGDGLALGNGAISLYELVQAYTCLANKGRFQPLQSRLPYQRPSASLVFSPAISSLIANILSDSDARQLEFGSDSVLNFPVPTAVKTGTSNDYHDAWAVGFNHRYTVGVWMGNLDQKPMLGVSGAIGPALVLRSVFTELNRHLSQQALYLDPSLQRHNICRDTGLLATSDCANRFEWFLPDNLPLVTAISTPHKQAKLIAKLRLSQPIADLHIAIDPRIPVSKQAFLLKLAPPYDSLASPQTVSWFMDEDLLVQTSQPHYAWSLQIGSHQVYAQIENSQGQQQRSRKVSFNVK